MKKTSFIVSVSTLLFLCILLPICIWIRGKNSIYTNVETTHSSPVGIVFGAGLTLQNTPSDALMDRLTIASEFFFADRIERILVSGDNHIQEYNEPEVMRQTLIELFDIPEEAIFADYAGRRTYDTCRRAHDLWGIDHAILISQGYHLPRAIWTCEKLGIESTGLSATLQPYLKEIPYKIREVGAIYKAFIDLNLIEPSYIEGAFIQDLDP
ncbi:YdcF family protein [Candidatus Uhrbacteria bacterium]|nr:YdcF family protein [Candidatus Uhrbacteria bacterium]